MRRDPFGWGNFPIETIEKRELAPVNARLVTIQVFVREPFRKTLDLLAKRRGVSRQVLAGIILETALDSTDPGSE